MIKFLSVFFIGVLALTSAMADKPTVYDVIPLHEENTLGMQALDKAVKTALSDTYQVEDMPNVDYVKAKAIAGSSVYRAQGSGGEPLIGNVTIVYVVDKDGKAHGAQVIASTDPRLNATALASTESWRLTPAQLHGEPVAVTATQNFFFRDDTHPHGFTVDHLSLYQDNSTLETRMPNVNALAGYVKQLEDKAQQFYFENSVPESLQVVVAVRPGNKSRLWFISSLGADDGHLEKIRHILNDVPPPSVVQGPIVFNIVANIAGGDGKGPTGTNPDMPQEWKLAAQKLNKPSTFDEILDLVWPNAPG